MFDKNWTLNLSDSKHESNNLSSEYYDEIEKNLTAHFDCLCRVLKYGISINFVSVRF